MNNKKEYIVCAAIRRKKPRKSANPYPNSQNEILTVELGYRHHDILMRFGDELSLADGSMGFYTSKGRFLGRYEAMKVAYAAGQVTKSRAMWLRQKDVDRMNAIFPDSKPIEVGEWKPLASEDLYCCSEDGNTMNE